MKAALYARVSTEDQAREEKVSLETQISDIEQYCKSKGYEMVKPYYIDIQSGLDSMRERPQFEQMLGDAQRGMFNVIVAWQPDRLFRSMWPAARLKRMVDETGIDIEGVKQPLDKKMLGLWAWLAEMEIENFRERSRMGKRGVAGKGQIVSRHTLYGYDVDDQRHPQINEAEACVVRRIFCEYVARNKSGQSIANDLNRDKVPLRNGGKFGWSSAYIHRILENKAYIGLGIYGKERRAGKKRRKEPEESHIPIPFPSIVDEQLFMAAQQRKAHAIRGRQNGNEVFHLLRGIAYCRECNYRLLTRVSRIHREVRRSGRVYEYRYKQPLRYYKCFGMFRHPDKFSCRKPTQIRASDLDELVWQKLVEVVENPAFVRQGLEAYRGQMSKSIIAEQIDTAKKQINDLAWNRQKAISLQIRGVITEQDLATQLKFIDSRNEVLQAETQRLTEEITGVEERELDLCKWKEVTSRIRGKLSSMTERERAELAQLLIQRVWVDGRGNVEIEFVVPTGVGAPCNAPENGQDSEHDQQLDKGEALLLPAHAPNAKASL